VRRLAPSLALAALLAGCAAEARPITCEAEVKALDGFGRLSWFDDVAALPAWAQSPTCFWENCEFSDPEGVHYATIDRFILDKELTVSSAAKLPWGLKPTDRPIDVMWKLRRLTGLRPNLLEDEGQPMIHLLFQSCDVWVEVHFNKDNRVEVLSLNAQP